ncbi:MAG: extracellular solute-binding protein [Oscillospiraceae bacterium]|nr:extracellular solute-binding protein [Oscillospiraceae bacterium]
MKRFIALLISITFLFVMVAACGDNNQTGGGDPTVTGPGPALSFGDGEDGVEGGPPTFVPPDYSMPDKDADVYRTTADGRRHIIIGTFYDMYYDSTHNDIFDNPTVTNPETAQMELDTVRYVEDKYNVYIEFVNMTWDGIIENIPISIMSGFPDADVYLGDTQFIIPAILNGMGTSLEDMGIPSNHDVFAPPGESIVMESFKIPGQDKTYMFRSAGVNTGMYMLGYNREILQRHGLEDPQDLWGKGEWTWDVFKDYCRTITDVSQDIYGYSGYWTNFLQSMLFTNDTAFAGGPVQTLDSPKTLEVLNFIHELYNVDKTARPWNPDDWSINNSLFAEGKSGFWISAFWINDEFGGLNTTFDIGMVPFPVGPQGNAETMATTNISGNYYFIPRYIKDADEVFNVMYDLANWFDGDLEYRDDLGWFFDSMISQANIDYYMKVAGRMGFDLFDSLGFGPSFDMMIENTTGPATYTPAQYVETFKQVYQDALDNYFGN